MPKRTSIDSFAIPQDFAVYQHFNRQEDMAETIDLLREANIVVRVSGDDAGEWTESVIMGAPLKPDFWIEIPSADFEKANFLLRDYAEANLTEEEIDAHPFADYSAEELKQVLIEDSGWSPLAIAVARKLLLRKGEDVDLMALRKAAQERIRAQFVPKKGSLVGILGILILGVFSGLVLWFIGLMLAFGVLMYYAIGTLRDPDGKKHYAYTKFTRQLGKSGLALVGIATAAGLLNFLYFHLVDVSVLQQWLWRWP